MILDLQVFRNYAAEKGEQKVCPYNMADLGTKPRLRSFPVVLYLFLL